MVIHFSPSSCHEAASPFVMTTSLAMSLNETIAVPHCQLCEPIF
jgi:hypothetical protein